MASAGAPLTGPRRVAAVTALCGIAVLCGVIGAASPGAASTEPPADGSAAAGGPATEPTLTLEPSAVVFGGTLVGSTSDVEVVMLTASGGTAEIVSVRVEGQFDVDHDCASLADGGSCEIRVRFAPTEAGSAAGQLVVESGTQTVGAALEGTAILPLPTGPILTTVPPSTTLPPTTAAPTSVSPTAPGTTSPPTTSGPETREECDARALQAEIGYAPSLEMRVDEPATIEATARIGEGSPDSSPSGESTIVVPQPLRCQVRARLLGGDNFSTNPDDWQEASFLGTSELSWRWVVTPRVVGENLFLILEVQGLRFDAEVGEYVPAGDSFQEEARIRVSSKPQSVVSRVNDAVSGVVTHPVVAFAGAGGLIVAIRWALQRRSKGSTGTSDG